MISSFSQHIKKKLIQAMKGVSVIKKPRDVFHKHRLFTIYKSFDKFCQKNENMQCNAALAITGAIKGTSQRKLYEELALKYLASRRWLRRLCTLLKIKRSGSSKYFFNVIPQ